MPLLLFVDDDDAIVEVACALLADIGVEATGATSAQAAIDALRARPFDAMVTDVHMPRASGLDLVRTAMEMSPSLRVAVSSGSLTPPLERFLTDHPSVLLLQKPYRAETLARVAERLCAGAPRR